LGLAFSFLLGNFTEVHGVEAILVSSGVVAFDASVVLEVALSK
jgi:hypothetical protein